MPFPALPGTAWPGQLTPGDPGTPTPVFPQAPLGLRAELLLPGGWSDTTAYLNQRDSTVMPDTTRGRQDEAAKPSPSASAVELNNRDGRFSMRNPTGPYYGKFGRNTAMRLSLPAVSNYLRFEGDTTSYAATGAAAPPTGDLEARTDLELSGWVASVLASQWVGGGNLGWAWLLNADGTLGFWWTTDGATVQKAVSTQPLPWPGGRVSLRVTYAHTTGLVTFYYASSIDPGSWTQLGTAVASASGATGAIWSGTAPLQVGANSYFAALTGSVGVFGSAPGVAWAPAAFAGMTGKVYEARLYQGIGGALIADGAFTAQAAGTTSFTDGQGNTWALSGTAELSGRAYRAHGEVAEWPPRWDTTGRDVWTPVTVSGLLRRLQQAGSGGGTPPLASPMTRGWKSKTTNAPVAYWPCEDGTGATQLASGVPGGQAMHFGSGAAPSLAAGSSFPGSAAVPTLNGSSWWGAVTPYTPPASPAAVVRALFKAPSGGDTDQGVVLRLHTTGDVYRADLSYSTAHNGSLQLAGYDGSGNQLFSSGFVDFTGSFGGCNGVALYVSVELTTSGGHVAWAFYVLQPAQSAAVLGASGSITGAVGAAVQPAVNPKLDALLSGSAVGQVSVQAQWESVSAGPMAGPVNAWVYETAGLRVARLCSEQGLGCRIKGPPSASVAMGAQGVDTMMNLLQECEDADRGMLAEARDSVSLVYRTSGSMCAQSPVVTLDYAAADLGGSGGKGLEPNDDDQLTVNDVVVTRKSATVTGTSWTAQVTTGPLSTQGPPNGVGDYQGSYDVNAASDSQLPDAAGWVLHLGTVDESRYPIVPLDLSRTELGALTTAIESVDLGDYVEILNPPGFLVPDPIKAVVWGVKETLGGFVWRIELNTTPESPYEVLIAGSGALTDCRDDTDGSTLATGCSSSATSLSVATATGNPIWTTAAGDLPFDVVVAGERMTVTAVTGSSSPQSFTVTRSVNGVAKSHLAGEAVVLFQPCYFALA
ncbi:MAG TPA: hypothetical protein VGS19_29175 [Streptosporangiaceae bacterium]|nr:hypothetical protein [Streptosporangiaceae bacterium]